MVSLVKFTRVWKELCHTPKAYPYLRNDDDDQHPLRELIHGYDAAGRRGLARIWHYQPPSNGVGPRITTDWIQGGNSLDSLIRIGRPLSGTEKAILISGFLAGRSSLHVVNLFHGTLTALNVRLDGDYNVYLTEYLTFALQHCAFMPGENSRLSAPDDAGSALISSHLRPPLT
jgi:hypothetical protein